MDAPNAPNPANPNAQGQFVDAVQGPSNQAQDPTIQNQALGPAVQNQAQGLAIQNPAQGPVIQNQARVPAGQIPTHSSCCSNTSSRSCTQVGQNIPSSATTTTSSSTTSPCWYCSACSPDNLSKLDREET